jgi:hypothetical protein
MGLPGRLIWRTYVVEAAFGKQPNALNTATAVTIYPEHAAVLTAANDQA